MSAERLIDDLRAFGDMKVWSFLVTLIGDTVRTPEDHVTGPAISGVAERLGIKPEALRVALHRLRKDGWVESRKSGRVGLYHMTPGALRETEAVRDFVYASDLTRPGRLWLVSGDTARDLPEALPLEGGSVLVDKVPIGDPDLLVARVENEILPAWLTNGAVPRELSGRFVSLLSVLTGTSAPEDIPEADRIAVRILVLHSWRRLVLRTSPTALAILPDTSPASRCRMAVHRWLSTLPPMEAVQTET